MERNNTNEFFSKIRKTFCLCLVLFQLPAVAFAEGVDAAASGLEALVIFVAVPLVFFMQAGFALVESGMSRSKNAANVLLKNFCDVCFGSLLYFAMGYGLMFGTSTSGWFGSSNFFLLELNESSYGFFIFQAMFAAASATIMSGAMAERTTFVGYIALSSIVMGIVYPVFGHWAWNSSGWLNNMGFIDFAGSTVVHSVGGFAALAGALIVKPRIGRFGRDGTTREIPGHNAFYTAVGGLILWVGWFGFNAGSNLVADSSLGIILTNTHLAACAGVVGIAITSKVCGHPLRVATVINGCLGGLVAITAGCATMAPHTAVLVGLIGGVIVLIGSSTLKACKVDDVVDAISVHGFAGVWGTLAAGMFVEGSAFSLSQVVVQGIGVLTAFVWAFGATFLFGWLITLVLPLRAPDEHQRAGLDHAEHSEVGYPEFMSTNLHQ